MKEIILVTISGEDRPGITGAISAILADYQVNILDIGQAVIHDNLSLGFLLEMPQDDSSAQVIKELLFYTHEQGFRLRFTPVSEGSYSQWVAGQGKPRHIITLLARKITAAHIAKVTEIVAEYGLNIDRIDRLSGRVPLDDLQSQTRACVEFSVRGGLDDAQAFRRRFMTLAGDLGIDIAYQEDDMFRRTRRLVAFDMDSTLIEAEVIDELAAVCND